MSPTENRSLSGHMLSLSMPFVQTALENGQHVTAPGRGAQRAHLFADPENLLPELGRVWFDILSLQYNPSANGYRPSRGERHRKNIHRRCRDIASFNRHLRR